MEIKYIPESDTLTITLSGDKYDSGLAQKEKFLVSQNVKRDPVEIEIYNASRVVEMDEIKIIMPTNKKDNAVKRV